MSDLIACYVDKKRDLEEERDVPKGLEWVSGRAGARPSVSEQLSLCLPPALTQPLP